MIFGCAHEIAPVSDTIAYITSCVTAGNDYAIWRKFSLDPTWTAATPKIAGQFIAAGYQPLAGGSLLWSVAADGTITWERQ